MCAALLVHWIHAVVHSQPDRNVNACIFKVLEVHTSQRRRAPMHQYSYSLDVVTTASQFMATLIFEAHGRHSS